jgi:hypothetical protein
MEDDEDDADFYNIISNKTYLFLNYLIYFL